MGTTTTDPSIITPPDAPVQLAAPPITTRNSYPPGQPQLGGPPKPLMKTPTSVSQIEFPISGVQGTLYQGPIMSGPTPGVNGAVGTAYLCLALQIDWSMGNFNLPIQFPGGSFIQSFSAVTYEAGLPAGVSVSFGKQQGATDIGSFTLPAKGAVLPPVEPTVQLPIWGDNCPTCPFQAWLSVGSNTGATAGGAIVLVQYVRLASPWSAPAIKQ